MKEYVTKCNGVLHLCVLRGFKDQVTQGNTLYQAVDSLLVTIHLFMGFVDSNSSIGNGLTSMGDKCI